MSFSTSLTPPKPPATVGPLATALLLVTEWVASLLWMKGNFKVLRGALAQRVFRRRCVLGLVGALSLFSSVGTAHAHEAPMCGGNAASVVAPLPAPPSEDGTIDVAPCQDLPDILRWDNDDSDPPPNGPGTQREARTDLAWVTTSLTIRAASARRSRLSFDVWAKRAGVRSAIDKPPRA